MRVAIVILNWNGEQMLKQYLPSVLAFSGEDAEVYVADNASTDGSLALLSAEFPTVKQIILDKNWGFADGYNKSLAQIDTQYFVLLNSDIEVTPNWLQSMLAYMDSHKDVAACMPKLLSIYKRNHFEYAGAAGGFIDRLGYPFCRGRIFNTVEEDNAQYNEPCDITWATGACLMVRSKVYWNVGGLDGRFFAHQEEIDFCWRLRLFGHRIVCLPDSKVYHVGGGTLPKSSAMKTFLNFRNNLTMLYKNLTDEEFVHVMRLRRWLDYVSALQILVLERNWAGCKAVFAARKAFKAWRNEFEKDRKEILQRRVIDNKQILKSYAILWQYYVKNKRFYRDI